MTDTKISAILTVEGLRKWRFQAAVRDGVATRAWTTVRVRFRLDA